ncbi:hypothetical protein AAW14_27825 [Streptomyces hygroscopicus]|nr:hypothetical protein [Streptomyces hygroscopicus]
MAGGLMFLMIWSRMVKRMVIPRRCSAAAQLVGVGLPELRAQAAYGLVGDDHTALEHELFDFAEAEREAEVQPHAVGDHLHRVPVPPLRR